MGATLHAITITVYLRDDDSDREAWDALLSGVRDLIINYSSIDADAGEG